jgi:chaperonin GroES
LKDRVLIQPVKEPKKTKGGIYIPESAKEKPQQAIVVEVGDDKKNITVKKGDRVIYEKFGGTEIEIDGETHLIIKMNEILAVIKK